VVLVGETPVVCGTEALVPGTVVVRGTLTVLVVAGASVVVVVGGGVVVDGGGVVVVVGGAAVVEVVEGGGAVAAAAASLSMPLVTANEPRKPPRTSALPSPGARGRSLGPTRRTDMGYPLARSIESPPGTTEPQPGRTRDSTRSSWTPVRARVGRVRGVMHLIVPVEAGDARAGRPSTLLPPHE
jgi:hypothetical protein